MSTIKPKPPRGKKSTASVVKTTKVTPPETSKASTAIIKVEETPPAPEYVEIRVPSEGLGIHAGQLFTLRKNMFFTGSAPVPLKTFNIQPITPGWQITAPKIPLDHWSQIVAFHKWCVATFRAETHISHLLTEDGRWVHCPFHQQVTRGAMTVQVDYTTPENLAIFEDLRTRFGVNSGHWHATTHNHVTSGAFASGTDKGDEMHKQGYHLTVGHCDKPTISIDARVRILMAVKFDNDGNRVAPPVSELLQVSDYGTIIDIPGWCAGMPEDIRTKMAMYHVTNTLDEGFPAEWKDYVTEKKFVSGPGVHKGGYQYPQYHGAGQSQYSSPINEAKAALMRMTKGTLSFATGASIMGSASSAETVPMAMEAVGMFEKKGRMFTKSVLDIFSSLNIFRHAANICLEAAEQVMCYCTKEGSFDSTAEEYMNHLRDIGIRKLAQYTSESLLVISYILKKAEAVVPKNTDYSAFALQLRELRLFLVSKQAYDTADNVLNQKNVPLIIEFLNTVPDQNVPEAQEA